MWCVWFVLHAADTCGALGEGRIESGSAFAQSFVALRFTYKRPRNQRCMPHAACHMPPTVRPPAAVPASVMIDSCHAAFESHQKDS